VSALPRLSRWAVEDVLCNAHNGLVWAGHVPNVVTLTHHNVAGGLVELWPFIMYARWWTLVSRTDNALRVRANLWANGPGLSMTLRAQP
jgi:hypothetical protein